MEKVSRNEYLFFLLKEIFTQFFDGSPIRRSLLAFATSPLDSERYTIFVVPGLIGAENKAILENTLASLAPGKHK